MYHKHIDIFLKTVLETLGVETAERDIPPHPTIVGFHKSYVREIAENAMSRDTNIYHGKVMTHTDARKLVTLDEPLCLDVEELRLA